MKSNLLKYVMVHMDILSPRWKNAFDDDNPNHLHPLRKCEVENDNYVQYKYELRCFDRGSFSTQQVLWCHSSGRVGCDYFYEPHTNMDLGMCKRSTGMQHHELLQGQGRLYWSCSPLFNTINNADNIEGYGLYFSCAQITGETHLVSFEYGTSSESRNIYSWV